MKLAIMSVLVVTVLGIGTGAQVATRLNNRSGENMLSTNQCIPKGGVGVVNAHLDIDLKATKNELILDGRDRWVGQSSAIPEIVFYFQGGIRQVNALPVGFDLSEATILSFEGDTVRFFDFARMSGGFYRRPRQ